MTTNLLLSFFADGDHWENIIKLVAYPVGISYPKPFRYRNTWIEPGLLRDLPNLANRNVTNSGLLGMRFKEEQYLSVYLPIRKVTIRWINLEDDECNVYFVLGEMVDYSNFQSLDEVKNMISCSPEIEKHRYTPYLFKTLQQNYDCPFTDGSEKKESVAWSKYVTLINADDSFPIKQEAKKSIFVRFSRMTEGKPVYKSREVGIINGFIISEGKTSELSFHHRIPFLINKNQSIKTFRYAYDNGFLPLELQRSAEEFSSNYEKHNLIISTKSTNKNYGNLAIKPETEQVKVNNEDIYAHFFEIPIKIKTNLWYRFVKKGIWYILFALGLGLQAFKPLITGFIQIKPPELLSLGIPLIGVILSTLALLQIEK